MSSVQETKLIRTCVDGDPHTLVLRRTPTDAATLDLLFDAVAPERPTDALAVTDGGTEGFLEAWCSRVNRRPRNVGVISVGERMWSTATTTAPRHDIVRGVADPTDTESILNVAMGYLDVWPADGRTVVHFHSMAPLLDRLCSEAMTDFLEEFVRALDARDAVGYFCLTPTNHDEAIVREVASLFDTVVECVGSAAEAMAEPSVSDCFDVISDPRRRYVLAAVSEGDSVSVEGLAGRIAAQIPVEREQLHVSLVSVHLPKLADFGMIAYDPEADSVEPGRHFGRVEPYLRKAMNAGRSE
jgi:DNA-binding transcriptional ArsR family regulator